MKNLFLLLFVIAGLSLSSCVKKYSCMCTVSGTEEEIKYPVGTLLMQAELSCDASELTFQMADTASHCEVIER